jgi:hypothetical protein
VVQETLGEDKVEVADRVDKDKILCLKRTRNGPQKKRRAMKKIKMKMQTLRMTRGLLPQIDK